MKKMNINVFKNNKHYSKIDLKKYIIENNETDLSFFIGRGKGCHINLKDMKIGRQQAELICKRNTWSIVNHNDFNEILVNGNISKESVLKNGDVVSIGPFMLVFELENKEDKENDDETTSEENADLDSQEASMESEIVPDAENDGENVEDEFLGAEDEAGEEASDDSSFEDDQPSIEEEGAFDESGFDNTDNFPVESGDSTEDQERTGVFNNFSKFELKLSGKHAPYDKFIVDSEETFIGSDSEKCQVALKDPEVSKVHAVIEKHNNIYILKDLKSKNGIMLNKERINSHELNNGDKFLIGTTKFFVKIVSNFLRQELDHLMPIEENQVVEVREIVEVGADFSDEEGLIEGTEASEGNIGPQNSSLFSKEALQDPEKRRKILIIAIVLIGGWVFLDEDGNKKQGAGNKSKQAKAKNLKSQGSKSNSRGPSSEKKAESKLEVKLTNEQKEFVDMTYVLAKNLFSGGKYRDALMELDRVHQLIPSGYKKSRFVEKLTKEALKEEERLFEEARKREAMELKKIKIEKLIKQAQEAFAKENIELSEGLMNKTIALDPDNQDVAELKLRIDAYNKKKEREALEKAEKEAERKRQENALEPGKTFYLKESWYKAILKLEDFLRRKNTDEDLIKKANSMLIESKNKLKELTGPLLGQAQLFKKNQDLKNAYENYLKIIDYNPAHEEALKEMVFIREKLQSQSRKAYREAIISESLSLFNEAKEKFQEVQQISPTDSKYYKKATNKLKEYLD